MTIEDSASAIFYFVNDPVAISRLATSPFSFFRYVGNVHILRKEISLFLNAGGIALRVKRYIRLSNTFFVTFIYSLFNC